MGISVTTKGGCSVKLIFGKEIKDMANVLLNRLETFLLTMEMWSKAVF